MPVVVVEGFPSHVDLDGRNAVRNAIVEAACQLNLGIKPSSMSVRIHRESDPGPKTMEIIVITRKFNKEARDIFITAVVRAVKSLHPDYMVEGFVLPFDGGSFYQIDTRQSPG